jgi:signal transduction histidine kinase
VKALRRIDQRYVDWLLALGLGISGAIEIATIDDLRGPLIVNLALVALVAPAALMRRRRPLPAILLWGSIALLMAAFLTQPSELDSLFLGLIIFPWAVGSHAEGRASVAGLVVAIVAIAVVALDSDTFIWGDIFFPGTFAAMFWLAGRAVRSRSRLTAELHEATLRLHEQREAEAEAAVAEERRRIAREMHDVVAHSVSTMVIQAGGARRILARDPGRAVEAAALIERTGREALGEMRHLLGVLHAGEDVAELAPQPTLHELEALAARSRAAGLPVELHLAGARGELPPGVELAAYRVIQEALTNSLKHGGASATVTVEYAEHDLRIAVADVGGGPGAMVQGSGHGLVGMRERVRVFGGELQTGPRPGGGFEVRARLPLQNEEEAALAAAAGRDPMEARA